jgi:hypothetical protein
MREVHDATKGVIPHRGRRSEAIAWLQKNRWLTNTIGGMKLEA